eukprot:scaffold9553_cov33-Tisochrysis_lutea.AAC.2
MDPVADREGLREVYCDACGGGGALPSERDLRFRVGRATVLEMGASELCACLATTFGSGPRQSTFGR